MATTVYGINENPATERSLDTTLVATMQGASAQLRAKETDATNELIARYESQNDNLGSWDPVIQMVLTATQFAIEAVSMENQAMYQGQWLSGGWQTNDWANELIAVLKQESADNNDYCAARRSRWDRWYKDGSGPTMALEQKRLEYVAFRKESICEEIHLLTQLDKFGEDLRKGNLPGPISGCSDANAYLVLLYKKRLERYYTRSDLGRSNPWSERAVYPVSYRS